MATHRHKVLVVEDDTSLRKILSAKISRSGHEPVEAADSKDADKALKAGRPCLVFLDILLPVTSGLDWLAAVRKERKYADLPVMIISQFDQQEVRDRAKTLGVADYVVKANTSLEEILLRAERLLVAERRTPGGPKK